MFDLLLLSAPVFLGIALGVLRFRSRHRMRLRQPFEDALESIFPEQEG